MVTQTQLSGLDALVADPELLAEAKLEPHNLWIHFEEHFPEPRAGMNLAQLIAHWCGLHRDMIKVAYLCTSPKRERVLEQLAQREAAMISLMERLDLRREQRA